MVILSAKDGKILTTLPLAGSSDGAFFNPATMEAFSTHGNGTMTIRKETGPTSFEVEQNLETMTGAKTLTLDAKTGHILTMAAENTAHPPPTPPTPARGRRPRPRSDVTRYVFHPDSGKVTHVSLAGHVAAHQLRWRGSHALRKTESSSRIQDPLGASW